jgi:hypothetical protein
LLLALEFLPPRQLAPRSQLGHAFLDSLEPLVPQPLP